jgi:hypothetical protein
MGGQICDIFYLHRGLKLLLLTQLRFLLRFFEIIVVDSIGFDYFFRFFGIIIVFFSKFIDRLFVEGISVE